MTKFKPIRNFDSITATSHAINKIKQRNIGAFEIERAINEGSVTDGETPTTLEYRLDMPTVDLIVVVDIPDKKIVTAYYSDEQGATGGRL